MKSKGMYIFCAIFLSMLMAAALFTGCTKVTAETTAATTAAAAETTAATTAAAAETTAATAAAGPWVHGIADIITTHPFHRVWIDAQAKEIDPNFGCTTIFKDANAKIETQINDMENLIQMKPDVITVNAVDSVAIEPSVKKALDAGIPTQSLWAEVKVDGVLNALGDDYGSFQQYAHLLAAYLDYKGNVLYLAGQDGNSYSDLRKNGFLDTIKDYPDIKVLDVQASNWEEDKVVSIVETWLNKYPEIDAIVFVDDQAAAPAIETIKSANRTEIVTIGWSGDENGLKAIDNGEMLFDALLSPQLFGWYGTQNAYLLYRGVKLSLYPGDPIKLFHPIIMSKETFDKINSKGVKGINLSEMLWKTPEEIRNFAKELPTLYGKEATDKKYNLK